MNYQVLCDNISYLRKNYRHKFLREIFYLRETGQTRQSNSQWKIDSTQKPTVLGGPWRAFRFKHRATNPTCLCSSVFWCQTCIPFSFWVTITKISSSSLGHQSILPNTSIIQEHMFKWLLSSTKLLCVYLIYVLCTFTFFVLFIVA